MLSFGLVLGFKFQVLGGAHLSKLITVNSKSTLSNNYLDFIIKKPCTLHPVPCTLHP